MRDLALEILVPRRLGPREGEDLLRAVEREVPAAMPGRCGRHEPVREPFAWDRLGELWSGDGFLWRAGARGAAAGHVIGPLRPDDRHTAVVLRADPRRIAPDDLARLLAALAGTLRPDYGFVHRGEEGAPPLVSALDLEHGLPRLHWANLFGPPYVELLGADVLRSAPAPSVSEPAPGVFVVQVTADAEEARRDPAAFEAVRDHLGRDAFAAEHDRPAPRTPQLREDAPVSEVTDTVDVLERLFDHAARAIAEDGHVTPVAMALVEGAAPEVVAAESRAEVDDALRALARRAPVTVAALLSQDRDALVVELEVGGEEPFVLRRDAVREPGGVRLGEPRVVPGVRRGWVATP